MRLPALPFRFLKRRWQGLPGSWGTHCLHALFFDPGGTSAQAFSCSGVAFRSINGVGSRFVVLTRLNHTACSLAVYASQPGSPRFHARLASGWRPPLPGGIGYPQGSYARFQLRFPTSPPPRPGFAWRTTSHSTLLEAVMSNLQIAQSPAAQGFARRLCDDLRPSGERV